MKKVTLETYSFRGNIKVLESASYSIKDDQKEIEVHYNINLDGNKVKAASSKRIDGKYIERVEYSPEGEISRKLNYYYYGNGQLKRCETIYNGVIQQYTDYKLDDKGNVKSIETDDTISYFQKITNENSDKYSIIGYHYDKFMEIVEETIEVQIFKGELIIRQLSYDSPMRTFKDTCEVRKYYDQFEHFKSYETKYSDFSGVFLDIPKAISHYETHYDYYQNGKLRSEIQYLCMNNGNNENRKKVREEIYDENGICLSNNFNVGTRFETVLNEKGDWIERKKFLHDQLINITYKKEETIENIE